MDPSIDPQAEDLIPEKKIVRTGKTPSGMPWTTYATPFGEQTYTQEQEEKWAKQIEEYCAPRIGVTYKNLKLGDVVFTNEEEEASYREAALTLPQATSSSRPSLLCKEDLLKAKVPRHLTKRVQKLLDFKPAWYRRGLDGPLTFVWYAKILDKTYLQGFRDEALSAELSREMDPRLHEVFTRKALEKLNLPAGSDGGFGFWKGDYAR
ncbi:MAG: hypothetical protein Q9207_004227 [Kuettlingeria erythrocarpa]